jgi:hypothetical protein
MEHLLKAAGPSMSAFLPPPRHLTCKRVPLLGPHTACHRFVHAQKTKFNADQDI